MWNITVCPFAGRNGILQITGVSMVDFFKNMWSFIATTITHISIFDIVDILLVSVLVYTVIKFARDTRAAQLFKGIILLIILLQVAELLNLSATR